MKILVICLFLNWLFQPCSCLFQHGKNYLTPRWLQNVERRDDMHLRSLYADQLDAANKIYLVEFRGILADQRLLELQEALAYCTTAAGLPSLPFQYEVAISDTISSQPIAIYTSFPNDDIASKVVERCATVRAVIDVWGAGVTPETCRTKALSNQDSVIRPYFPDLPSTNLTWKVDFQRYGRAGKSGLDPDGKRDLLQTFNTLLQSLHAEVDLVQPTHVLRYLEDWHAYHALELEGKVGAAASSEEEQSLARRQCFFGRVVAYGLNINHLYALSDRSFVGTTSMKPVNAHVACVLAKIGPNDRVLDPFCGTASVLIAAAHLQAKVIGSDIADDFADTDKALFKKIESIEDIKNSIANQNEGKTQRKRKKETLTERALGSKNTRFLRRNGHTQWKNQPIDSFEQYQLQANVLDLFQADAHEWLLSKEECTNRKIREKYHGDDGDCSDPYFVDAIVSDPPFGRREKFWDLSSIVTGRKAEVLENSNDGSAESSLSRSFMTEGGVSQMGDPYGAIPLLCQLATLRLRNVGQRLVFWLPTDSQVDEATVKRYIQAELIRVSSRRTRRPEAAESTTTGSAPNAATYSLRLCHVGREEMSSALTRWLCTCELICID